MFSSLKLLFLLFLFTERSTAAPNSNFTAVSFDTLSAQSPFAQLEEYGGLTAYSAVFQSITSQNSSFFAACLCFIATPSNSSYILSIYVYASMALYSKGAIIWMANRDHPVSGNFSLKLDDNLVLSDGDGSVAWSSSISSSQHKGLVAMDLGVSTDANVNSFGNLVLSSAANGTTLWQSADHPSHTLIMNQLFYPGSRLVSWAGTSNAAQGQYSLVMEAGGLVLYYSSSGGAALPSLAPQPYWAWGYYGKNDSFSVTHTCKNSIMAFMDPEGALYLISSASYFANSTWPQLCTAQNISNLFPFADYGSRDYINSPDLTFLQLQFDGNLLVYTLGSTWTPQLDLFQDDRCSLPNICGPYGVCSPPSNCQCPSTSDDSFPSVYPSNSTQGCPPNHQLLCTTVDVQRHKFVQLLGVDYFANAYSASSNFSTVEDCTNACLQNCSCLAAFWHAHSTSCFHAQSQPLGSLKGSLNSSLYIAFIKVQDVQTVQTRRSSVLQVVAGVCVVLFLVCALAMVMRYWKAQQLLRRLEESDDEDPFLDNIPGLPTRYTYSDLKTITNEFCRELGRGGFGVVYAGTLKDGTEVAVKKLMMGTYGGQGKEQFRAEVVSLGGAHHYNLVDLLGFCMQGSHRLLVYERVARNSLDHWLFTASRISTVDGGAADEHIDPGGALAWRIRFNIALGAAQGLVYLHNHCREKIIHMDVKPQNILLDENFVAKVSDFGLCRLVDRKESVVQVTRMRGTPGYLAPEWLTLEGGGISEKCDVYSFGKVLMEILGSRKNLDMSMEEDKVYFPAWVYHKVQLIRGNDQLNRAAASTTARLADCMRDIAKVETEEEIVQATIMMNTAFLCMMENPASRPSMETVLHMLEGRSPVLDLELAELLPDLRFALSAMQRPANNRVLTTPKSSGIMSTLEISGR